MNHVLHNTRVCESENAAGKFLKTYCAVHTSEP